MRKIFTLFVLSFITVQFVNAQTIIRDEVINFSELAAYEAAHPELFKHCATCPKKEADGGWEEFVSPNMPIPPGGVIKMSQPLPIRKPGDPSPDAPSRPPLQNYAGDTEPAGGGSIPPDTYGAVGLNHVVTGTNEFITIRNKVGGSLVSQVSISTFASQSGTCDPQLFFDPTTQRWIFAAIQCNVSVNNAVILMTSLTSDPTGSWRKISWLPESGYLLDHPYLGYDDTKIVIGGRGFGTPFKPILYLVDKAAMLAGTAITFGGNAQTINGTSGDGDSPRPVTVYYPPFSTTGNPSPGTVYIVQSWSNTSLRLTTVTGAIPAAVWNTGSAVFPTAPGGEAWTAGNHGTAGSVQQPPPETRRLASNDSRVSSAVMMNGKIWLSQHCAFPAGASGTAVTHTDAQYWQLEGTPGGTFGNVLQRGRTGAAAGQHRWFSSIAVNKFEDVIVGYSHSTTALLPSASYSTREASTPANILNDPLNYKLGIDNYWKDYGSGRPRWGDYSQSHLDPVDNSLWTIQEYASTRIGTGDNASRWATWWAQVPASGSTSSPLITASGAPLLVAESCAPANGVVDPGETVTMSFCLQNTGTGPTVNAVGTLLATGGITAPSGPQNYGVIVNGGAAVCRSFTFTNNSTTCLSTITASIQVQDGATNLGTITYAIQLGTTVTLTAQTFDAVVVPALPAGWSTTGSPTWASSNSGTPTPVAFSAPNSAVVANVNFQDSRLQTPSFAVTTAGTVVSFRNNYNVETNWDGGVLEYSINAGATWTDVIAGGGTWLSGGYNGTLNTGTVNALAGRQAWTGSSGGFILSSVRLPNSTVGQTVILRFRMGSDDIVVVQGWRIDDFRVAAPSCCGVPCVLTCPANITTNAAPGLCGAPVTFAATASGLCGVITYSPASGSLFPVGTTTVNVSTESGATCSFTVTVVDNTPPTITCPANISVPNDPGVCQAVVTYPFPAVADNCPLTGGTAVPLTQSVNNTTIVPIQIGCQAGGLTTANSWWRAYDLAPRNLPAALTIKSVRFGIERSQSASGSVPVTVRIYTSAGPFPASPLTLRSSQTMNVPNQTGTIFTIPLGSPATVPANAIVAVELFVPDMRVPPYNGAFFIGSNNLGETGISYISAPDCGVGTPTPIGDLVTVTDHIILDLNGEYYTSPPTLVQIAGLPRGATFPVGVTTNTWRATDANGLQSTCSFTVTVNDTEAPVFTTCRPNVVINTDAGQCYATYTPLQPVFTDNCAVTALTWSMTGPTGTVNSAATGINYIPSTQFQLNGRTGTGLTTITYTARDAAGNTRTCSWTVRVNDASIPVITVQPATRFVCVGSDGVFSVTANAGTGNPLTYQWQRWNGTSWVDIAGATNSSFTVPSVTFAMNTNSYRVALAGRCSDVISDFATLYVNPLPTVSLLTSIPPVLLPPQSLTISSNVSPGGGSYAWFKNNVLIAGSTASSLSGLTVDDIGTYKLVYTDPNGCVSTSSDIVVSGQPSSDLYVYPNPNNGQYLVRFFNQPNESATVRVYDSKGAKVFEKVVITTTAYTRIDIDLGPTAADGVYITELVNAAGKRVGAKRVIVRRR